MLERRNIRRCHRPDAEGGDGGLVQQHVKGDVGGDTQLAPDVVAVNVGGGIRLGVAQLLRFLEDGGEIHRGAVHGVHDEVGGPVHNAAHGAHRVQPLYALQIRQPRDTAAHRRRTPQSHALLCRQSGQLAVIGGDQRLVRGDHVLAPLHGGGDVLIRRVQPAHDLHHRVDGVVVENVVHIEGTHVLRQTRLGTTQQHTRHADVLPPGAQLPHAAAHYAKAQQSDIHTSVPP